MLANENNCVKVINLQTWDGFTPKRVLRKMCLLPREIELDIIKKRYRKPRYNTAYKPDMG